MKAFSRKFCFLKLSKSHLVAAEKQNFILKFFKWQLSHLVGRGVALTAALGPCQ